MARRFLSILLLIAIATSAVSGFAVGTAKMSLAGGSSFVVSQRPPQQTTTASPQRTTRGDMQMGGKVAKFGIFSPAVYAAKFALGSDKLNKLRGKGISLHSQAIGDFCSWAGAYHLRTRLIKKAKTNGDILGFLV
mmetsp:Transcript_20872/g.27445  ORF Transcript_20872/g.27445 Transcript_20872/m.27445 type:complete len:135 (+) Transcript_20872:63-467(+)|eukprot:CAMPEP_0195268830 /NCGR_PEP_ID=MMETSP0706-20130129/13398_1 /TAXON_ID=33640 /ORGANISM="Asterionellopsis glacialis, Strain CCMP134" /LENGTH=134 /DNA_ID=CAMNT_0040323805 /DNA_START=47 /DNA_END=451 /DNA_ORIENTATION=+